MYGEIASAAGNAASQVGGAIADIKKQEEAAALRKLQLAAARQMPVLQLGETQYGQIPYMGDFTPGMYDTPEAAQYQTIDEDPQTRAIEMAALQQLVEQGNGAADARMAAQRFGALDDANQLAKSREGAIRQQFERRGQGGAGLNAVLQAQSAQMGANRARAGTMDAVSQAAMQKLAAQQMALQGAGGVRAGDFRTNSANADIVNRFNQFNTAARNRINEMNTGLGNDAQLRNLNTRQDLSGRNVGIGNSNIDRNINNKVLENNSRVGRTQAVISALGGQAGQAANSGQVYNQLGQQGAQMFTNIGAGISAAQNANPQQPGWDEQRSNDGSFYSTWER